MGFLVTKFYALMDPLEVIADLKLLNDPLANKRIKYSGCFIDYTNARIIYAYVGEGVIAALKEMGGAPYVTTGRITCQYCPAAAVPFPP